MNIAPDMEQFGSLAEIGDDVLISLHLDLRCKDERLTEDFKKAVAPIHKAQQAIEAVLYSRLVQRGSKNTSTERGTAYRIRQLTVKCLDKMGYLRFCFGNPDEGANLLTANVSKDALTSFLERHNDQPPPGISVGYIETVQIRRT